MNDIPLAIFTIFSGFLVLYHHLGYPLIMQAIHRKKIAQDMRSKSNGQLPAYDRQSLPSIGIVIPAYNEQQWIAEKIRNLAMLDYPSTLLKVIIACDGCNDDTANIACRTVNETECRHLPIEIRRFATNRGKVAVINEVIKELDTELIALSDVSALISIDALLIAADQFQNPEVGVLNSHYQLLSPGSEGEATYWKYQSRLKASEAALGSTLGAHGAFYLFRRSLFKRLAPDTINDDFILPMQIVAEGYRAEHEDRINALELEGTNGDMEQQRRRRIAAGNLQQLLRLKHLLLPRYGYVAFTFASGKGLRVLMPILMLVALLGSLLLAHTHAVFALAAVTQVAAYSLAAWQMILKPKSSHRYIKALAYLVSGHLAGLIGALRYLIGLEKGRWKRIKPTVFHSTTR